MWFTLGLMRLTFLGHAAFLVQTLGYNVVFDPFSPGIGYAPLRTQADLVSLSHDNPKWHSHLQSVGGEFSVFDALEHIGQPWDCDGVLLESIPVFESWPDDGEPQGPNAMVKMTSENLRVLHMGDVGHALGDDYLEALGEIDVVLAPVGGPPTIEPPQLKAFLHELNPKIVVPMHFMIPGLKMQLEPLDAFLNAWEGRAVRSGSSQLEISMATLPDEMTLQVLEPSRLNR